MGSREDCELMANAAARHAGIKAGRGRERIEMNAPIRDGLVLLNVEGKRFLASFRIKDGVITVTSGSASMTLEVGDVANPKSVARTVLRTMFMEGSAVAALTQAPAMRQVDSMERPRSSLRYSRTHQMRSP